MKKEVIRLWQDSETEVELQCYENPKTGIRPAMLVIPGGGYANVCQGHEGYPIAKRFSDIGFRSFVLIYRVAPHRFPAPQLDAYKAIEYIRSNADKLQVNPDNIAVCGFSAGGHLAASLAIFAKELGKETCAPNGVVLAYPVISSSSFGHQGSFKNLLGEDYKSKKSLYSLEKRVEKGYPATFCWHTAEDSVVPVENSLAFARSMWKAGNSCEMRIFQAGGHGLALGYGRKDISAWPQMAKEFLIHNGNFSFPDTKQGPTVVLTFDDATCNHLTTVAPLLKKYGFGATFFPCNFDKKWQQKNRQHLMTPSQLKELQELGFEIGNHTDSHPWDMTKLSKEECAREISTMNEYLRQSGVKVSNSFAYPCGIFDDNVIETVKAAGFSLGRTTIEKVWDVKKCDPMKIPAIPIMNNSYGSFYAAVSKATAEKPVVLVLHGIPEIVHAHCSNTPEFFEKMLSYLKALNCRVIGLQEAYELLK